jgi:hypothetical protein
MIPVINHNPYARKSHLAERFYMYTGVSHIPDEGSRQMPAAKIIIYDTDIHTLQSFFHKQVLPSSTDRIIFNDK